MEKIPKNKNASNYTNKGIFKRRNWLFYSGIHGTIVKISSTYL